MRYPKKSPVEQLKSALNALQRQRAEYVAKIAALDAELNNLGITPGKHATTPLPVATKRTRAKRKNYPVLTLESVTAFVKEAGKEGCPAMKLLKHFGPSFAQFRRENGKKFKIQKSGTSRIWFIR